MSRRPLFARGRPLNAVFSSHAQDRLPALRKLRETISNLPPCPGTKTPSGLGRNSLSGGNTLPLS